MLKNLQDGLDFLKKKIIEELAAQGHKASGSLERSIELIIEDKGSAMVGKILMNDYSLYLDKGVPASRVPYYPGSGRKLSKYIDALIEWSRYIKPALSEKERKSFAFAVATVAKKEGHPTSGSYAFSSNGRRKAWHENAIEKNLEEFEKILKLGDVLFEHINNLITEFTKAA